MQYLVQDAAEVAEVCEEVTRAPVTAIMARAHAAQAERMAEVTQRVFVLGDEPATARKAMDAADEKILSLEVEESTANQRREAAEE
jgi:UDP-N-acetyl-D-mannosaminuronic acid transferase (WecB/TagA/CpsF family)